MNIEKHFDATLSRADDFIQIFNSMLHLVRYVLNSRILFDAADALKDTLNENK